MHLSQWASYKCSCHPYKYGQVIHAIGVLINGVYSWACLNCLQAHVAFFDLSGKYPKEIHVETFACIGDLPECLQFWYLSWDEYGEGPYGWDEDRRWDSGDHQAVIETRRGLDLVLLDGDLFRRRVFDEFDQDIPF